MLFTCTCRYILYARELPILSMMERIRTQVMNIIIGKQTEVEKWSGTICPKIKKLEKNAEMANTCYAIPAGMGMFVSSGRQEFSMHC